MAALSLLACVETGEIQVRNATDSTIIVATHSAKECSLPQDGVWTAITSGREEEFAVVSGSFVGEACLSVTSGRTISVEVESGRTYEVTRGEMLPLVQDVGEHDEPWYFDMQRWEWSWSSWWVWLYLVPVVLGAPAGLYITVRYFYRYYVLKQA